MATVIRKDDLRVIRGVRVEDYIDDSDYMVNPIIPAGVPGKYLKISGDAVVEMTAGEKETKDTEIQTAIDLAAVAADRAAKIKAFADTQAEAAAIAAEVISE